MNEELARLADEYWELELERSPTTGLFIGDYRRAAEMEDLTRAAEDEFIERLDAVAAAAEAIDPATLTADEQVTRAVMMEEAAGAATELRSRFAEFAVDPSSGLHVNACSWSARSRFRMLRWPMPSSSSGRGSAPRSTRRSNGCARASPGTGPHRPSRSRRPWPRSTTISPVTSPPTRSSTSLPRRTSPTTRPRRGEIDSTEQVVESVRPGYAAYRDTLWSEVLEKSRPPERTGLVWLPDGGEAYAGAIRRHTSLDLAPLDIHNIGLERSPSSAASTATSAAGSSAPTT